VADRAAESEGLGTLGGSEIGVAGAEGEAIGVADDGADDDFRGEAQIGDEAPDDGNLGGVFLAKLRAIRLGSEEQLGNNGGDSAKVAGPGLAVQALAQGWNFDKSRIGAVWVELFD